MSRILGILACVAVVCLTGCAATPDAGPAAQTSASPASTTAPGGASTIRLPPEGARFDYQLGGDYAPASGVAIVDRDSTGQPAAGLYNICYINAFQTQPGELGSWQQHHAGLLLQRGGGPVMDPDWPGEALLNTATASSRQALAAVVGAQIDECARKGFDAIEPDNLDSWTRSHGLLTVADNLAFATLLSGRAHADGLAIAQKNAAELGRAGRKAAHFDFAVAEECQVYAECSDYMRVYGRHVIEIEYTDDGRAAFRAACAARGELISIVLRDRDVVARNTAGYVSEWCG